MSSSVTPLTRKTADGGRLRRPEAVERSIAEALDLDTPELLRRAKENRPEAQGFLPPECLTHLVRHHLRYGDRDIAERVLPFLLKRCERVLRNTVRGFGPAATEDVRAEILGLLAVALAEPGDGADFFEVRFALAFKRLTIDVCRRQRRYDQRMVTASAAATEDEGEAEALERLAAREMNPSAFDESERLALRQALERLDDDQRRLLLLHRGLGIPINARQQEGPNLVDLFGVSERTVRYRLRRAEATLRALVENEPCKMNA